MEEEIYKKAYEKIKLANNILLITHDTPDGDALASVCALIDLLKTLEKKYFAYCFDLPPYQFDFLPHIEKILNDKNKFNFSDFDLIIVLDCGGLNRTKIENEINNKNKNQFIIEFDHHPKIDNYADLELRDPAAASTTEMVYRFLKINNLKINKNIANCILTGILTDTANFLYPSTSDQNIEIASEMLKLGARLPQIMENTWRNKSLASMKIWGTAMSRLQINHKYNFAYTILTLKDIKESKVTEEELEGIASFLGNLHPVKAVLFLREKEGGIIKGSLRTADPQVNLTPLAQALGGGGHAKASGFKFNGKIKKTANSWEVI